MFRIGDKVAHPMHGAGVIDDIVTFRRQLLVRCRITMCFGCL